MDISRLAEYFIACYTVLMRLNKVETAVRGCNCWLSVWTLSRRCPVKLLRSISLASLFVIFFLAGGVVDVWAGKYDIVKNHVLGLS